MLFKLKKSSKEISPHIKNVSGPDIDFYSIVELSHNDHFFVLELLWENENNEGPKKDWQTFFIESIETALSKIKNSNVSEHNLSIYVPRNIYTNKFEIFVRTIKEIYIIKNEFEEDEYLYSCSNGLRFQDGFLLDEHIDFIDKELIYKKSDRN